MREHEKKIKELAKQKLVPKGFFQIGSSRKWIKDNSFFVILIEFQPSGWEIGTFVNVAVSFLWESSKGLFESLSFNVSERIIGSEGQFIECDLENENSLVHFSKVLSEYIDQALKYVDEWDKLKDINYAKRFLIESKSVRNYGFWEPYKLAMICFLSGKYEEGKGYFDDFIDHIKKSCDERKIEWEIEFYNYCVSELLPQVQNAESAKIMVQKMINRRRAYFCSKSSYKKMNSEPVYKFD